MRLWSFGSTGLSPYWCCPKHSNLEDSNQEVKGHMLGKRWYDHKNLGSHGPCEKRAEFYRNTHCSLLNLATILVSKFKQWHCPLSPVRSGVSAITWLLLLLPLPELPKSVWIWPESGTSLTSVHSSCSPGHFQDLWVYIAGG